MSKIRPCGAQSQKHKPTCFLSTQFWAHTFISFHTATHALPLVITWCPTHHLTHLTVTTMWLNQPFTCCLSHDVWVHMSYNPGAVTVSWVLLHLHTIPHKREVPDVPSHTASHSHAAATYHHQRITGTDTKPAYTAFYSVPCSHIQLQGFGGFILQKL